MIYHAPHSLFKGYTFCNLKIKITPQNYFVHQIDEQNMLACDKHDCVNRAKVTCPVCLYKITPGASLYKNCTGDKKFITNENIVPAIISALRAVDFKRRGGDEVEDTTNDALVYLLEQGNIHVPETKCSACRGSGRVSHSHGMYCYKESWGEDVLVCNSSYDSCSTCNGSGIVSEETIFKSW
jgi:hypothetical protein